MKLSEENQKFNENLVDHEFLTKVLSYNPNTGDFTWLKRSKDSFPVGNRNTDHNCNLWNSKYHGKIAGTLKGHRGYSRIVINGVCYLAHRLAYLYHFGQWPSGCIDHINGEKADNRIENLRVTTPSENSKNQAISIKNTSGQTGVSFHTQRGMWQATIHVNKKQKHLGLFSNKEDASKARKEAEAKYNYHENHGRKPTIEQGI